jgi:hypothetical protein
MVTSFQEIISTMGGNQDCLAALPRRRMNFQGATQVAHPFLDAEQPKTTFTSYLLESLLRIETYPVIFDEDYCIRGVLL